MKKAVKIIIIILMIIGIFFLGRQSGLTADVSTTTTNVTEETVSVRNIQKELTTSGQIETATTEKLELSSSQYFKTMCVEEDDTVKAGENILEYSNGTYMVAPYNCVVSSYSVPETGKLGTSSNYVEIKSLDNLVVSININENEVSEVQEGQEVELIPTADTSKKYTGTICKIDSIGTYQTSGTTYTGTIAFTNDGTLKIGMSISCTILLEEAKNVLTIPINAVQTNNNEKYVVIANEDGTTKNVTIETGIADDNYVEVISGLQEGEKVKVTTTITSNQIRNNNTGTTKGGIQGNGQGGMMRMQDNGNMPNEGQGTKGKNMPNQ